jgi:dTDP-4-amino-4,6-dideoxygalactose transaminase
MATSTTISTRLTLPSDQDHTGRTLGSDEIEQLTRVIRSGTLTSTKGEAVPAFERQFAQLMNVKHAFACSSGSAAVHCAIAAINPEPGDEFITTPITDMGALTPILYQTAIPVFADVDPRTYNLTAESIRARISDRTRGIIVTHLFGNPCDMDAIMAVAEQYRLPVIEDTAQAFLARWNGRAAGTIGTIGCFSLQQGKHITTGEGGIVVTNDDQLARRIFLFINKAWGYGDAQPDHYFLAPNYRMCELQGAVALAQLSKLADVVARRAELAEQLTQRLTDVPGLETPVVLPGGSHSYWKYCLGVDATRIRGGAVALGAKLREQAIACAPRYIQKPAFRCQIFRDQQTFGTSRFPFTEARPEALDYSDNRFSGTYAALERVLVLPWNEKYELRHVEYIAAAVRNTAKELTPGALL